MNVLRGKHIVVECARHTVSSHLRRATIAARHARRRTVHRLIQVKHRTTTASIYLLRGREDLLWVRTKGGGQRALDPLVEIVTQEGVGDHHPSRGGWLLLLLRLIKVR